MTGPSVTESPADVYRRVTSTPWPATEEARWAIGWAAGTLWDALVTGDEDEASDAALALEKRLAEHQRREAARRAAEDFIAARNLSQFGGLLL